MKPDNPDFSKESPLEFPCDFPLKVMGKTDSAFKETMIAITKKHIPELCQQHIKEKLSSNNKYLSLTLTVRVSSREQLDKIYRELHATGLVLMAL